MTKQESFCNNYTSSSAQQFAESHGMQNTRILIYRDIEGLINKYSCHGRALDLGCGPGISTRFLANLGFEAIGADISKEMLMFAFLKPDGIPYVWMEPNKIPFKDNSFDLVLAVMVLLEISSLELMLQSVKEVNRVLKPGGLFVPVVASEHLHKHNWVNRSIHDMENNHTLKTGDTYTTYTHSSGMTFTNYVYTHKNYQDIFRLSKLHLIETHHALGKQSDGIDWKLELELNPFTHYVCQK